MSLMIHIKVSALNEVQREFFEERAGILEYQANMHRDQAEEIALQQTIDYYNLQGPQGSCA